MRNHWQKISLLFYIVPFLGIFFTMGNQLFGPGAGFQYFLTFVGFCLLLITASQVVFRYKTWHVNKIDVVWGIFVLYIIFSCLIRGEHNLSKFQSLFIALGLYGFFRSQTQSLLKIKKWFPLLFALLSLSICTDGFLQYAGVYPSRNGYFDVTSFFINPAPLAAFLTVLIPYLALPLLEKEKKRSLGLSVQIIVISMSLLSSLVIIVLVWSRTSWVALAVMITVYCIVFRRKKRNSVLLLSGIAVGFCLLVGGLYFLKPQSANGRLLTYLVSFHIWKHAPLFGIGWHNYGFYYNQFQAGYFQHHFTSPFSNLADDLGVSYNEFVHIAVELGIAGLILFIGSLFVTLNFTKTKSASSFEKSAWLSMVGIIAVGLFSYPLSQPFVWVLFIFNIAILSLCNQHALFRVSNLKLKAVACIAILVALGLIYRSSVTLKASLKWEKAFHIVSENPEKGLNIYARLYPKLKDYPAFLYNYGYELSMAKRYSKSLALLQKARSHMYNYDLLLRTGYVQQQLSNYRDAEQQYKQAHYLIPSRLVPCYLLMKLYEDWSKRQKAIHMAKQILQMKPKVHSEEAMFLKNQTQVALDSLRYKLDNENH